MQSNGSTHDISTTDSHSLYVNPGILADFPEYDLSHAWIDTWYFTPYTQVGVMALNAGPVTSIAGVAPMLTEQVAIFRDAFAAFTRLSREARVFHKQDAHVGHTSVDSVVARDADTLLARLHKRLASLGDVVVAVDVSFDVRAAVRTQQGQIAEIWFPLVGHVYFGAESSSIFIQADNDRRVAPWNANLTLVVASLFRRNNRQALVQARHMWQKLLVENPLVSEYPEDMEADRLVTLADPPIGTPLDNQELYERNAPRLWAAIQKWEQATGHAFRWAIDLGA